MECRVGAFCKGVLFVSFCFAGVLFAKKATLTECVDPRNFTPAQKQVLVYAYRYGLKDNLGYELAAIAWKESCAGMYRVNFNEPSAGIYHAYIPHVLKLYNERDTSFMQGVYGDLLIKDQNFASRVALDTLVSWKRINKGNLKDMIKSYHRGLRWQKSEHFDQMANEYYEDIVAKIKTLQSVMPALEEAVDSTKKSAPKPIPAIHHEEIHHENPIRPEPKIIQSKALPKIALNTAHSTHKSLSSRKRQKSRPHYSNTPQKPQHSTTTHPQPSSGKTPKNSKDANSIILMQESPVF
ncbi:hypothetical protein HSUHS5_0644 [Helicobacter suis HS5]|uniref:Transglycosylase SLT domain-containing protein n=1 Tax=Helicobacter suis HS5 TaxID=710394 RepID=E7G3W0_9HELI|nr:hypothetical protein HSUHS5_0644 [Helicobacter suis HS5]